MRSREGYARMSKEELLAELEALRTQHVTPELQNGNLHDTMETLEASHIRHAELYDLVPVAYFTCDHLGRVLEVNRRGAEMLGYDKEQIIGRPFAALARFENPTSLGLLRRCLQDGHPAEGEMHFAAFGRDPVWVQASVEPVLDQAGPAEGHPQTPGRVTACRMVFADVTALKARAEMARAVLEQIPEAVVLVGDEEGAGVSFNAAAKVLFGSADGQPVALEVHAPNGTPIPVSELPHARAARGESIAGMDLRILRGDGAVVPVVVSAAPVRDSRAGAAVAVYRDVSAAKRLEQEREEWTSVVAHDLRQPATVISFSAQLLARFAGELGPREARSVARIGAAAHVLSRMIDDLLDVTLIDLRRLVLKRKPVDLAALANEVVDRCRPMFGGHTVQVQAPGEPAIVLADPERVAQVLTNLLSNAAKYSEPESDIGVRVARREDEVEVAVDNRGPGMTAEEAARVFLRFYRTRAAQTGALGGLGLGLYICKGLVEEHDGRIGVESVPGGTTTFWFCLPKG
jgi:PAS domain S-box-containing protein